MASYRIEQNDATIVIELTEVAEQITLRLEAKPGVAFDPSEIAACLEHRVRKLDSEG